MPMPRLGVVPFRCCVWALCLSVFCRSAVGVIERVLQHPAWTNCALTGRKVASVPMSASGCKRPNTRPYVHASCQRVPIYGHDLRMCGMYAALRSRRRRCRRCARQCALTWAQIVRNVSSAHADERRHSAQNTNNITALAVGNATRLLRRRSGTSYKLQPAHRLCCHTAPRYHMLHNTVAGTKHSVASHRAITSSKA